MHWAQRLDNAVAGAVHGLIDQLPPPMLYGLIGVALMGILGFGRLMLQGFATKAPPIFEGVPFIGGILKFAKVRIVAVPTAGSADAPVQRVQLSHKNCSH